MLGTGQDRTHMLIVAKDLEHIYTANVASGTISIIRSQMRNGGHPRAQPPGRSLLHGCNPARCGR